MVHPLGATHLSTGPGSGRVGIAVTVATAAGPEPLVVELADDPDPGPALAALAAVAGTTDLVVDRTGTPFRGAVVGRDLLPGDHLVAPDRRRRPQLVALVGPLRGAMVVADRELVVGRGGRFGDRVVDDPEMSRDHLRISPTPAGTRATDQGSTNGTLHDGEPLTGPVTLRSGDRLEVGTSVLVVVGDPPRGGHLHARDGAVDLDLPVVDPAPDDAAAPRTDPLPPRSGRGRRSRWRRATPSAPEVEPAEADPTATPVAHPDPASVAAAVAGWSPLLWARAPGRPGHLTVRLGALPTGSPCVVDLHDVGPVALVGDPDDVVRHAAAWLLHLAATHPPDQLELTVGPDDPTAPIRGLASAAAWLPHAPSGGAAGDASAAWAVAFVEAPVDGSPWPEPPATGPPATTLWLARPGATVPAGTAALEITAGGGSATWCPASSSPDDGRRGGSVRLTPDLVEVALLDDLARLLAPLVPRRPAVADRS